MYRMESTGWSRGAVGCLPEWAHIQTEGETETFGFRNQSN